MTIDMNGYFSVDSRVLNSKYKLTDFNRFDDKSIDDFLFHNFSNETKISINRIRSHYFQHLKDKFHLTVSQIQKIINYIRAHLPNKYLT